MTMLNAEERIDPQILGADKEYVAVSRTGTYYFARGYMTDKSLNARLTEKIRSGKLPERLASKSVELAAIQRFNALDDDQGDNDRPANALLGDLYDVFRLAADIGASDIKLVVRGENTEIRAIVHDEQTPIIKSMPRKDGEEAIKQMWNAAGASSQLSPLSQITKSFDYQNTKQSREYSEFRVPRNITALRCAKAPNVGGHHIIARIFYQESSVSELTLEELFPEPEDLCFIDEFIQNREGAAFIAGKTGDGKSTTLDKILEHVESLFKGRLNLMQIGNPIETINPAVIQISVEDHATREELDEAYRENIRHLMRAHPHLIELQEIRDAEAADSFLDLVKTGHMGQSTIHGSSANTIPFRLIGEMGVTPERVAAPNILKLLMRQVLVYQLCDCAKVVTPEDITSPAVKQNLAKSGLFGRAKMRNMDGCDKCQQSTDLRRAIWNGRRGMQVVPEFIRPDSRYLRCVAEKDELGAYQHWVNGLNGKTIPFRLRALLAQGVIDVDTANSKGAFSELDYDASEDAAVRMPEAAE